MKLSFLLAALLLALSCCSARADTSVVYEWEYLGGSDFNDMTFTFDGRSLSLNTDTITGTTHNGDHWVVQLLFSGTWGTCGSFDYGTGDLTPDPYAAFVGDGIGSGHIQWTSGAPLGHTTTLLLGYPFSGDGAPTYTTIRSGVPVAQAASTIALNWYRTNVSREWMDEYQGVWRDFTVTNAVPEPSSLLSLACGLAGLGGLMRHRRRG
jgi:hypothetical protein